MDSAKILKDIWGVLLAFILNPVGRVFWVLMCETGMVWDIQYSKWRGWIPTVPEKKKQKARKTAINHMPEDKTIEKEDSTIHIEHQSGQKRITVVDHSGGAVIDWESAITGLERSPEFTSEDKLQLELSNDFENISLRLIEKSKIIKKKWATKKANEYLTNKEISDTLTKEYNKGYSLRTIKAHTSCFSKALYEQAVQMGAISLQTTDNQ